MKKKIFMMTLIASICLFFSSFCFAANDLRTDAQDLGNEVKSSADKAGQSIESGKNRVENIVKDGAGSVKKGAEDVGNTVRRGAEGVKNGVENVTRTATNDGNNYTATRTATTMFGMSGTTWSWIILLIVALAIIALVWYYMAQNTQTKHSDE